MYLNLVSPRKFSLECRWIFCFFEIIYDLTAHLWSGLRREEGILDPWIRAGWIWNRDTVCYTAIQLFLRIPYFSVVIRGLNRTPPPSLEGDISPFGGGGGYGKKEDKREDEKEKGMQMGKRQQGCMRKYLCIVGGGKINKIFRVYRFFRTYR